jgi:hypothetical protein
MTSIGRPYITKLSQTVSHKHTLLSTINVNRIFSIAKNELCTPAAHQLVRSVATNIYCRMRDCWFQTGLLQLPLLRHVVVKFSQNAVSAEHFGAG